MIYLRIMKILYSFLFFLAAALSVSGQEIRFLKFNGQEVDVKDSADFVRVVQPADSGSLNYPILEYYTNDQRKLVGTVSEYKARLVFEGPSLSYYRNGRKKSVVTFEKGKPAGTGYYYHPNGRVSKVVEFGADSKERVIGVYDSSGVQTVVNGTGYAREYDEEGGVETEGCYQNGRKHGTWRGRAGREHYTFEETYEHGTLTGGRSQVTGGKEYRYTKLSELPVYPKGDQGFAYFLSRNLKYPPEARDDRITGTVILRFMVEKDGSLNDIRVGVPVHPSLDRAALQVLALSPEWIPGRERGVPVAVAYHLPLSFKLSGF